MSQFDLYANTDKDTQKTYPWFIEVQTDLLDTLNSRMVIPLTRLAQNTAWPKKLCPIMKIGGKSYVLLTHQMTSISTTWLKKKERRLDGYRDEIISAIDFLITGI